MPTSDPMPPRTARLTALLTALAMLAFAGNSLLCRMALKLTGIDAASFTAVRLVSGALALVLLLRWRMGSNKGGNTATRVAMGAGGWRRASGCGLGKWSDLRRHWPG